MLFDTHPQKILILKEYFKLKVIIFILTSSVSFNLEKKHVLHLDSTFTVEACEKKKMHTNYNFGEVFNLE